MIISYIENNTLIFEKEITLRSVIKSTSKIAILTLMIILSSDLVTFAATPWYKQKLDQGGIYILLKFFETIYAGRVIEGIEQLEHLPGEVVKLIVDAGYTIEELIGWYIRNN